MTLPSEALIRASMTAARGMADRNTPLISVASDGPAVAMRRYLKQRSDAEHVAGRFARPEGAAG